MVRLVTALAEQPTLLPNLVEVNFYNSAKVNFRLAQRFVLSRLETLKYLGLFDLEDSWPLVSRDWVKRMADAGVFITIIKKSKCFVRY